MGVLWVVELRSIFVFVCGFSMDCHVSADFQWMFGRCCVKCSVAVGFLWMFGVCSVACRFPFDFLWIFDFGIFSVGWIFSEGRIFCRIKRFFLPVGKRSRYEFCRVPR